MCIDIDEIGVSEPRPVGQPRKELQTLCVDSGLKKNQNVENLKKSLLEHQLAHVFSQKEVIKYAAGEEIKESSAAACAEQQVVPAEAANDAVPSSGAGDPSSCGDGAGGSGSCKQPETPVLWGRQTFAVNSKEVEDKTSWFAAIDDGPEIQPADETVVAIMEQATDGIVPLAACIKMSQAFQEGIDDQVAVLLAGHFADGT